MEVTKKSTSRRRWSSPRVKTIESREPALMLVCSAATQWDCDSLYLGCGCVRKSADQQTDCDSSCGSPP
jgi:hypothetical protein